MFFLLNSINLVCSLGVTPIISIVIGKIADIREKSLVFAGFPHENAEKFTKKWRPSAFMQRNFIFTRKNLIFLNLLETL